jgi:hypothetical protein
MTLEKRNRILAACGKDGVCGKKNPELTMYDLWEAMAMLEEVFLKSQLGRRKKTEPCPLCRNRGPGGDEMSAETSGVSIL